MRWRTWLSEFHAKFRAFVSRLGMIKPSIVAAQLRQIAASATSDADLGAILLGLRSVLAALAGGSGDVVLEGPFKPFMDTGDQNVYEGYVSDLVIRNDEFNARLLEEMGVTDPKELAEYAENPPNEHTFHVRINWYWSSPEPDVGWRGGIELDGWELVALDGMELTDSDATAVEKHVNKAVNDQWSDWARQADKARDEDAASIRAEAWNF